MNLDINLQQIQDIQVQTREIQILMEMELMMVWNFLDFITD